MLNQTSASGLPAVSNRLHLKVFRALTWALCFLAVSPLAFGQSATSGAVSGTVTDPSGAVVAGATVELTSKDTNSVQTAKSNSSGQYTFTGVRPGEYRATVKSPGFKTASFQNVVVDVNKSVDL